MDLETQEHEIRENRKALRLGVELVTYPARLNPLIASSTPITRDAAATKRHFM